MLISKTTFLDALNCPKNTWLKLHDPHLLEGCVLSDFERHIMEQGNEVEAHARFLFLDGIEVATTGEDAQKETARLMEQKAPALFQATFITDGFIARNDVLTYDADTNNWNLYEVKGSNSLKEEGMSDRDHITDLAFQAVVLKRSNVPVGRYFVIHLNKEYVRSGALDIKALFTVDDVTDKVLARMPEVEPQMEGTREYLLRTDEPKGACDCVYKGRKKHCTTFQYSNPNVPEYSVHDISRISEKKLNLFVERGIYDLKDIPEDFELTKNQKNQVQAYKKQEPTIIAEDIKKEIGNLKYPLYFFDYEAFGPAVPAFNKYSPYRRVPFQFSLHILDAPGAEIRHVEYLHDSRTDPTDKVAALLKEHILPGGTVVVWHKSFEAGVNKEIADRLPEYAPFFERVNASLYDLKDVFQKQFYIHPGFQGRAGLKKVLPVLVPDVRYDGLMIQEGGQAADAWWKMVSPETPTAEHEKIAADLKKYCGLDTYAMVVIWEHLCEKIR